MTGPATIAIVVFPGFTALDAIGPYTVLGQVPGYRVAVVAARPGTVSDSGQLTFQVTSTLDETTDPSVVVVAGGVPAIEMARHGDPIVDWLRAIRERARWVTSVCTGSLLLGAAGILEGLEATSHWYSLDQLRDYGAIPVDRRVVESGNVITAAGVSAGIDMALTLASRLGDDRLAQMIQLDMEYAPEPPFTAGSPRTAPPAVTAELRALYDTMVGNRDTG